VWVLGYCGVGGQEVGYCVGNVGGGWWGALDGSVDGGRVGMGGCGEIGLWL